MPIKSIYANLSCSDLQKSESWFRKLFGRDCDAKPMAGLLEWHLSKDAAFQLYRNPANAGKGTVTLMVGDLEDERARLASLGFTSAVVEKADHVSILRLSDPDGNLVVLAGD